MSGPAWLVDSKRIATKIKSASGLADSNRVKWISNPTKACPSCNYSIDNSDVVQDWPGLPPGVKFDPSDQELLCHLLAKVGVGDAKPHPFINEFIPTVEEEDGICYTHPKKLPGVKQDGSVSHFFHRTFKAYNTGTRKRRKINTDDLGDVRWHKTGKTKPVIVDGKHIGCKKIMVLYMSTVKGEKPGKTNWVMHQYHVGTGEDEKDGEYVVSKLFYQQQAKPGDKNEETLVVDVMEGQAAESDPALVAKAVSPELQDDKPTDVPNPEQISDLTNEQLEAADQENNAQSQLNDEDNNPAEEMKWWDGESQYLLDSQQLAENMAICDEFLLSQTSYDGEVKNSKKSLSEYANMGVEQLKRDLEDCQDLVDPSNILLDTPPDFRLSQLEFGSQDSFSAWGGSKVAD